MKNFRISIVVIFVLFFSVGTVYAQSFIGIKNSFGYSGCHFKIKKQNCFFKETGTDTIIGTPQITLYYTMEYYQNAQLGQPGRSGKAIKTFSVGDNPARIEIGKRGAGLKPFLVNDALAYLFFTKFRKNRVRANTCLILSLIAIIPVTINLAKESDSPATRPLAGVAVVSFGSIFIFGSFEKKNLRKSVKTYNQDAGYGYVDGLENSKGY